VLACEGTDLSWDGLNRDGLIGAKTIGDWVDWGGCDGMLEVGRLRKVSRLEKIFALRLF